MRMDFTYNLTQEQKLILTQEMQLSIKILQMGVNDLREYINTEFSENPILDMKEDFNGDTTEEKKEFDKYDYKELVKYLEFDNYGAQSYSSYDNDEEISPFNFISEKKSLKEFLHEQLLEVQVEEYLKQIGDYIIECLDNKGYLECSLYEICEELLINMEIGEEALRIVQDLEPYGIAARDLKECLLIQLTKLGLRNSKLEYIVENSLKDIADNRYNSIAKALDISPREAQRYGDIIKKLEPKPSRGFFTGDDVKFIIPDAEIRNIQGEFHIIMNDGILPKLSISNVYKEVIESDEKSNTSDYVKEKLNKALFLIKSIDQRRSTLYKVLENVLKRQQEYFEKGIKYLRPMTLKEIAEELEIHESTVSRAIKEKYILTSFGTVKIKELFVSGISSKGTDEDIAVGQIKRQIKEIIDNENKQKPISDQQICDKLNSESVNISRRTVAKYREELGIKASSKRKRI